MGKPILLKLAPTPPAAWIAEPADPMTVLEIAADRARRGVLGAMATVLARRGSAPATPGQKIYVAADGTCVGTVGGGAVEREVMDALVGMLRGANDHRVHTFKLGAELGMCCGGSVDLLLEPLDAQTPLLIVGAGHVATALGPLLGRVGFAVTVVDAREAWAKEGRIEGVRSVVGDYDDVGRDLPKSAAVLVMTHDHALDQQAIEWALAKKFAFVGGVGSRAKAQRTRDRLEHKGVPEEDRARVRMPLGLGIGARLPQEIAVSIAAEMVAWRREKMRAMSKEGS